MAATRLLAVVARSPAGCTRVAGPPHLWGACRRLPWYGVLLLAAALLPAQQPATVTVHGSSTVANLSGDRLAASVAWLLGEWYGPALHARAATAGGAPAGTQLLLALTGTDRGLHLRSELVDGGHSLGERGSWLPAGSLGAVTATAAGDGFLLWSEARRFPHLKELDSPPRNTARLPAGGLARLLQRPVSGRDVQAAVAYSGGVLVLLADGPIAVGHRLDIVPDTASWLTWRERPAAAAGAPWRNLYPLHDGRVVLEPWSGAPVVTTAEPAAGWTGGPDGQFGGSPADAPPAGALLAIAPDATAVWQEAGSVLLRTYGTAHADAVRMPLGSLAPSATAADGGGAWWAFDPRERRLRAFAATGGGGVRQTQAITPMLPAEELGGVQALAIAADGQFLIGSQRAVWNVDRRGMPRWVLRLLHEQPRQRLPQAFTLTAGAERAAFFLLDRSTGSVHRFSTQPEPAAAHPATADAPKPGAVAAALTDSALHAARRAWQRRRPHSAALLLTAAGHSLKRWHAADPLAEGVAPRSAAIEQLSEMVEHALYGAPPLAPRIAPAHVHPALGSYYASHPFALTIRNGGRDRAAAEIELGIAGAASAVTVAAPALAAGEETTLPVHLHAPAGAGSTGVPHPTTLWLSAGAEGGSGPVLSAMPLTVQPVRCRPEQAGEARGAARAAFLHWHLAAAASAPALPAPAGLSVYRLVDRVARLAAVGAGGPCLQAADRTLATLSGSATDWALAVAGVLQRRGTPAALLVADAAGAGADRDDALVLVLAWFEHGGAAVDQEATSLPLPARQQVAGQLADAGLSIPPGRVWALQPHAAADGVDAGAAAWSRTGAEAAAAALAADGAGVHIVSAAAGADRRRPAAAGRARSLPPLLPLGNEDR